jgi:hypothetical protein
MSAVSRDRAVELLTEAVKSAHVDDLVEIHYELFPEQPISQEEVGRNRLAVVDHILDHTHNGLEPEEIVDLWNVVFPDHWGVSFDEEEGLLHYNQGQRAFTQTD